MESSGEAGHEEGEQQDMVHKEGAMAGRRRRRHYVLHADLSKAIQEVSNQQKALTGEVSDMKKEMADLKVKVEASQEPEPTKESEVVDEPPEEPEPEEEKQPQPESKCPMKETLSAKKLASYPPQIIWQLKKAGCVFPEGFKM